MGVHVADKRMSLLKRSKQRHRVELAFRVVMMKLPFFQNACHVAALGFVGLSMEMVEAGLSGVWIYQGTI